MNQLIVNYNNNNYKILILKKRTTKKLILRVNRKQQAQLSTPYGASYQQNYNFVIANIAWLHTQLNNVLNKDNILNLGIQNKIINICGTTFNLELELSNNKFNSVKIVNNIIKIKYTKPENIINLLIKATKQIFYTYCYNQANIYCGLLNKKFNKLTLTDTKSKWGSCSNKNNIRINFRLAFAPIFVVNYLIAHEICHLQHFNHSAQFWQTLLETYGDYKNAKLWLKENGKLLF